MDIFLQQHLDYLFFVYGLAFVLVAAMCAVIPKESARGAPWIWLGLFGLAHGFTEWLEIFAIDLKDTPAFSIVRYATMALSFVFLCVFAHMALGKLQGKEPGRWTYLPLLVLAVSGALGGTVSLQATTRYALALIGGLWAAWAMYQMDKKDERSRGRLAIAAIGLAGYAVAAGAMVPEAPFFPASVLNAAWFYSVVGVPVQLVRGALGVLIAAALWMYSGQLRRSDLSQAGNKGVAPLGYGLAIMLAVTLVAGWRFAEFASEWSDDEVRAILRVQARTAAAGFTPEQLASLSGTAADREDANYRHLTEQMQAVNHANPKLSSAHLLILRGDKILEAVSFDMKDPGRSEARVAYERPPKELLEAFSPGNGTTLGPYHGGSGNLVSAFAPIRDPRTTLVAGVVGVDISAEDWKHSVAEYRLTAIVITLLAVLVVIYFFIVRERMWRSAQLITRSQSRLNKTLEAQAREITERKKVENDLRESEERYRKLFELSPDGMLIISEGKIVLANSRCMRMLGATAMEELIGKPVLDIFHSDYRERVMQHMRQMSEENLPAPAAERKLLMLDGAVLDVEVATSPFTHKGKPSTQVVIRDITERKEASDRLNYLAQYDSLTDLPNRSLFQDRIEHSLAQAKRNGRPAALLYIDLDRFKAVNDTLGHAIGDKLLQQAAKRLSECVRGGDTVGRFGGDEFGVVLLDLARAGDAGVVAQKINDSLARPFNLDGHRIFVSASIGITLYPADATDPVTLSMNADTAMYHAKELGRNRYQFFTQEMNDRSMKRVQMEASMRLALERSEFLLHYQPKVDLASGAICGMEALLRWAHPEKGLVSPAEFIPVLEETGLIVPVGEWVMREACRQIGAWQQAGLKVPHVAVNLSARQFQQKNLEDIARDILMETGVGPALLQFEITESLLMSDPDEAVRILLGLEKAGILLSVDDFGTGYSSLAYLKRFPIDALKIDRAFIKDIVTDPDDAAIALAVISLAHSLKLKVVAEGVETEAQFNLLALHSCDEMQGYYFSRPVPAAELEAMLREGRRLTRSQNWAQAKPAVLLLDDNENDLLMLENALRSEDFEVLTATSPEEAFVLLASHPVGVVVSDQRMPGMDGAEFLAKIRRLYPNALRVAISGAHDHDAIADAVSEAGIHKFLSKNWDSERLRTEVHDAYRQYRAAVNG